MCVAVFPVANFLVNSTGWIVVQLLEQKKNSRTWKIINYKMKFGTVTQNNVQNDQKKAPMFLTWGKLKIYNGRRVP